MDASIHLEIQDYQIGGVRVENEYFLMLDVSLLSCHLIGFEFHCHGYSVT